MEKTKSQFLVLGAGVGGICSAIDLAETGYSVTLVEKGPRTGGIMPQLDHQFPDDHCGMCRMLPMVDREPGAQTCLKRGLSHPNIRILTHTTLTDLSGNPGDYTAVLTSVSRGVDALRCTRCMACIDVCPVSVLDAFNDRAGDRNAIYQPFFGNPEALPTIDWDNCTRCGECAQACPNSAIDLERVELTESVAPVSGVIVAGGNPLYDPAVTDLYGYGVLPNVVTATAFERILSGSGPFRGQPVRPSDGHPIRRVAWIQCVGSRNVMIGAGHCSSTCCMFAVKEALLAKKTLGSDTDTTIFYMDMRTYGRDSQRYRDRAEEESGVRFIRCRIHSVDPADDPGDLKLTYLDDLGQPGEATFDMVVLSTGAGVQKELPPLLADKTDQGAVVTIGPEAGLQDIRETVLRAHGAVSSLLEKLNMDSRAKTIPKTGRAGDKSVNRFMQQPVIQVLVLDNGVVKAPQVEWPAIEGRLERSPGNIFVNRLSIIDGKDLSLELETVLKETRGNRLLVVSNHIAGYRATLTKRFEEAGFSAPLVEWVDLNRNDVSMGTETIQPDAAMKPIQVALMRLLHKRPSRGMAQVVENSALVIGAGPAGLSAAVSLAEQGVVVHLVEKEISIGGNGPRIQDEHQRRPIDQLIVRAKGHPNISIHTGATLGALSGRPGHFEGWVVKENMEIPLSFGAAIIATGGTPAITEAYGMGKHPPLVSHFDFEKKVLDPRFAEDTLNTVVMIQCAGSREEPRNYCSRTCCVKALDNALRVRQLFPHARIVIFYRDIMTYGKSEELYAKARTRRIRFIPFNKSKPPVVRTEGDTVVVDGFDPVMGEAVHLKADWVSLAVGMVPKPIHDLCRLLEVPVTPDGFVHEADAKWRPVDTINPGVFVCGLAKGPLRADEAVAEGTAAALRALRLLNRTELAPQRHSAVVRHAICSRCYLCVDSCPYGARFVEPVLGQVEVDPVACQGCGTCASVCPNSATVMGENEDFTVMNVIEAALM
ncbi:MAG: CoB--CoM heterodisulfide reductase iron-sulfur subunit A family protein [Desulfosarcina sp.]|nr:CoB--CoM heterodisulfide reductase iron-sulfur subunit A family protein [Desulfosarcina sp.]MBC2742135.1 CoB--CoM heterodisulfide reductase iron-sulfur subunit A family protein [Desulfosarcina sp.]MBC2765048.1 CoB--CoM heterodisulfide reductase iron-sulfur subunit A family protein [Desulfosarcina sp.]